MSDEMPMLRYAVTENPENSVYPFEVIDLETNSVIARTSSKDAAERFRVEMEVNGVIENPEA